MIPSHKLGSYSCGGGVYNLYGQYHWNKETNPEEYYTDYDALWSALSKMERSLRGFGNTKIGFPLIGCGRADGNWNIVSSMIESIFDKPEYHVYIYTLEKLEGKEYVN